MRAVLCPAALPADDPGSLVDAELERPAPGATDLLVRVRAVSVNPIDTKMRMMSSPHARGGPAKPRVLGWDAAGEVLAAGAQVRGFEVGDRVFYAGSIGRPGSNSEFHCVDHRLVGHMPAQWSFAQAAALPLTALTAWEALFERLYLGALPFQARSPRPAPVVLIVGGAGGVGSMAIQLARQVPDATVLATASRPSSAAWCRELGAHHVLDHDLSLPDRVREVAPAGVDAVLLTRDPDHYLPLLAPTLAVFGQVCSIVEAAAPLPVAALRASSAGFAWEGMFTRGGRRPADMGRQGQILDTVAAWCETGRLRGTLTEDFGVLNAANLRAAHQRVESGSMIGKGVLTL
ncbi:MAG: zinc-binding alcohol dehydrogenase family protein [Burkholderiaceae bacterium]